MCLLGVAALALLAAGCASAPPPPAPPPEPAGPPAADRPFLAPPLQGWTGAVPESAAEVLDRGHRAILAADPEAALDAVAELVGERPAATYPPAAVLAAQADLLADRPRAAQSLLEGLAGDHPDYTALQLVLGRAAEAADDPVAAYAAFRRAAGDEVVAYDRTLALAPRVEEILTRRLTDALARDDLTRARGVLERLEGWMPEAEGTRRGALAVAEARGDRPAQLAAARELAALVPEERPVQERLAELELEVGDARAGLDIYESLAARFPDDPALPERLAYAKFRWRIGQMPPQVARAAGQPELQRGDLAVLLYWLVPRVRSARGGEARIASDILDDPRQVEITRVLNLGLMDRDPSVHRFYPERPVRRATVLLAALRLLDRLGAACAAPVATAGSSLGGEELRALALDCGVLRPDEGCALGGTVPGAEVVDLLRRTLGVVAGGGP